VTVARGEDGAGLRGARVVVVGAGEMGLGLSRALADLPPVDAPGRVVVVNRSLKRAKDFVRDAGTAPFELRAAPLEDVSAELAQSDVVLTAVASESHVLARSHFDGASGPLLVIDLGLPRNVDPSVGSVAGITLLDMDTLSASVARALGDRQEEAVAARDIVAAELERHRAQLADLSEEEWDQVDQATRATLAKMLHEPSILLKETAGTSRGERLVEALRILFDL
jgi:glutamyl-tRNA reductase